RNRRMGASMMAAAIIAPASPGATLANPSPADAIAVKIARTTINNPFGVRKNRLSVTSHEALERRRHDHSSHSVSLEQLDSERRPKNECRGGEAVGDDSQ